jgi:hypothetical protein
MKKVQQFDAFMPNFTRAPPSEWATENRQPGAARDEEKRRRRESREPCPANAVIVVSKTVQQIWPPKKPPVANLGAATAP